MNLVSIIIPVYNGEKYMERCLKSIVNSTYSEIEIIIINDGSKDGTDHIIKKWMSYDSRIKYIVQNNNGVSVARNVGINASTGKYIMFVDCDDWIDHGMVEYLVKKCEEDCYDLVTAGRIVYENEKIIETSIPSERALYGKQSIMHEILNGKNVHWISVCDKIYLSNIIKSNRIYFDKKLKYAEDTEFLYRYIIHTNKVAFVDKALYNHPIYLNNEKIIHYQLDDLSYMWKNSFIIQARFERMFKYTGTFNEYKPIIFSKIINVIRGLIHLSFRYEAGVRDVYNIIKKYYRMWSKRVDSIYMTDIHGVECGFVLFCLKHRLFLPLCIVEYMLVKLKKLIGDY